MLTFIGFWKMFRCLQESLLTFLKNRKVLCYVRSKASVRSKVCDDINDKSQYSLANECNSELRIYWMGDIVPAPSISRGISCSMPASTPPLFRPFGKGKYLFPQKTNASYSLQSDLDTPVIPCITSVSRCHPSILQHLHTYRVLFIFRQLSCTQTRTPSWLEETARVQDHLNMGNPRSRMYNQASSSRMALCRNLLASVVPHSNHNTQVTQAKGSNKIYKLRSNNLSTPDIHLKSSNRSRTRCPSSSPFRPLSHPNLKWPLRKQDRHLLKSPNPFILLLRHNHPNLRFPRKAQRYLRFGFLF